MGIRALQEYLHQHIPLSKAMQVTVLAATESGVTLSAPLAPNINHRETVFGGSASAVAILSAWALLYVRLERTGVQGRVVIRRNTMRYELPMTDTFTALASPPDSAAWDRLLSTLGRRRPARVVVKSVLYCKGVKAGELEGEFVALPGPPHAIS